MISRCYNKKNIAYKNYGGRGILVCESWLSSFENFIKDMGYSPSINHSIDRINVNGQYEPNNCRWATRKIQTNNKRNNLYINYNGVTKTASEWSIIFNIHKTTISYRYKKGLPLELVFFNGGLQKNKFLTNDGKITELAKQKIQNNNE